MSSTIRLAAYIASAAYIFVASPASAAFIADIMVGGATGSTSSVVRQSAGFNLTTGQGNTGDVSLTSNGSPLTQESGAGIATPNTYNIATGIPGANADPRQAASYTGRYTGGSNSFANAAWLALGHIVGTDGGESNFPVSLGYFPYSEGWVAGTVLTNGTPGIATNAGNAVMGNFGNVTITHNSGASPITYKIQIVGQDSAWFNSATSSFNQGSGLLFVTDAANEGSPNYAVTAPVQGGWEVSIYDQNTSYPAAISGPFNFVYLPFATPNLIGGIIDNNGTVIQGVGNFQAFNGASLAYNTAPLTGSTGEYFLAFPDGAGGFYDETDGILMLTVSERTTLDDVAFGPEDNYLVYQPVTATVAGQPVPGFRIATHDLPGGGNETVTFSFAFLRYDAPIQFVTVPEPSFMLAALGFVGLVSPLRRRKR